MEAYERAKEQGAGPGFEHVTVLAQEAVGALGVRPEGVYVDGTAGGGGHSARIARLLTGGGRLIAIDKDPAAVGVLRRRLDGLPVTVVQEDFRNLTRVLDGLGIQRVDGVLLDLGVSSHQLDTPERGFSYSAEGWLDMRMSGEGLSAWDIVNTWEPQRIAALLREYGEERFSRQIARAIEKARPIDTTLQLADVIRGAIPAPARRSGGNPCKRSFQALRIAVNGELDALSECLELSFGRLSAGGRFAVITFHSLEDRIVKKAFAEWCRGCVCPPEYPVCVCGKTPRAKPLWKKPVLPSEQEQQMNPRSHSAKLRAVERIENAQP